MQTNYARYLCLVGNDWALAEQNPAYRTSVKHPVGMFFYFFVVFNIKFLLYLILNNEYNQIVKQTKEGYYANKTS